MWRRMFFKLFHKLCVKQQVMLIWIRIHISARRCNVYHTQLYLLCCYCVFHASMIGAVDSIISLWKSSLHSAFSFFQHFVLCICTISHSFLIFHEHEYMLTGNCQHYHHCGKCIGRFSYEEQEIEKLDLLSRLALKDKARNILYFSYYWQWIFFYHQVLSVYPKSDIAH